MNRRERRQKKEAKALAESKVPRGHERMRFDSTKAHEYIQKDKLRSSNEHPIGSKR